MTDDNRSVEQVRAVLEPHGLFLRGTVNFALGETAPDLADGRPARSVVLIGNVGSSIWPAFERWRGSAAPTDHPLDDWTKSVIRPVATAFGATPFFPSDPPFQPFQQWAVRAEGIKTSPLGILIHPQYGLWHGYRAALAFDRAQLQTGADKTEHPCDSCRDKPCLSCCPVDAVQPGGFAVSACRTHLATKAGADGCGEGGCIARNACPVGTDYRYKQAQLQFHMAALWRPL
ncbi:ferredoxin [Pararhizobium antarcticum]|uniref:Ferredoxin n=1 Tax=Pararhizobium antarcticum TaxID=1798805 RepID=A0A657LU07_9HYPH|nr:ferredoxin [Pararhizobium antarcticum]OJF91939.1 ferredoxin [Rhizobium sp. 58]OJF98322.1 ferredoxin [Pararhizobium antarcticum]